MNTDGPKIWVTRWVDYSTKYGISYMLSNAQIGVYFNDNTKIIQDGDKIFSYYERHGTSKEDTEHRFKLENVPSYAKKKVMIHE